MGGREKRIYWEKGRGGDSCGKKLKEAGGGWNWSRRKIIKD